MPRVKDHLFANPRLDRVADWGFNLGMMALFVFFAVRFGRDVADTARLSSILLLGLASLRAILYLTRRRPIKVSVDPFAWIVAVSGTWTPLLFRPVAGAEHPAGQALQIVGIVLQLAAVTSLNRSIGIVAANRGVRTRGLYRFVRHPLYAAYVFSYTGFLINQFSPYNATVVAFWVFFQLMRIRYEEELLLLDSEYQAYAGRTRWRVVPFVF